MRKSLRRGCTCCTIASVICCALVAMAVIALLDDSPEDPKFQVDSFSISNFTARNDSSKVSFAADVRLTARNPNEHLSISFGRVDASVYYKSASVARTSTPAFSLGKQSEAPLNASFAAAVGSFKERDIFSVGFDLRLVCNNASFDKSVWMLRRKNYFVVFCGDLVVGIPSNGTQQRGLAGGPKLCRVS